MRLRREEHNAQMQDRFLRERQIAHMIYGYSRVTGAREAVLDYTDLFSIFLQGDDVQDFGYQMVPSPIMKDLPKESILESLQKMRLRESVHLQTVLAMYQQESPQGRSRPNYQKLKTMVRRHTDQTIRARNFQVRNERVETGVLIKTLKGKMSAFKRTVFIRRCLQFPPRRQ